MTGTWPEVSAPGDGVPLYAVPDDAEDSPFPPEEAVRREIRLVSASKMRVRRVKWLWDTTPEGAPPTSEGRIPMGSLTIAAGGPGIGKSQFACWMTAHVTRGTLPGELFGQPRTVIYAATEDSWEMTIVPRLIAAGADLDLVFRIDVVDDEDLHARLTLPTDISLLGKTCDAYGVALFVADPLLSMLSETINDYRAKEVRIALEPLVKCASDHGFGILGLAHFTKNGAADPLNRIAGSGAFGQLIRSAIAFARVEDTEDDDEDRFVVSQIKNNLGRLFVPSYEYRIIPVDVEAEDGTAHVSRFVMGDASDTSVVSEMQNADRDKGTRATARECSEWLRDFLEDEHRGGEAPPKHVKAAATEAGFTENALREAKALLKVKSVKPQQKDASWVWQLPA